MAFISKNFDFPFWIKKDVFEACVLSSIMYSCESWINNSYKAADTAYMTCIKTLLGVRKSTPSLLCLAELDFPSIEGKTKKLQKSFLHNLLESRKDIIDDPFIMVWNYCKDKNTPGYNYLRNVLLTEDHISTDRDKRNYKIHLYKENKTKFKTYISINPNLISNYVYNNKTNDIPEYERQSFSRIRLSSHNLKIETGRWRQQPREDRLCDCGSIQTESHVIFDCPLTISIRNSFFSNINFNLDLEQFFVQNDPKIICNMFFQILQKFS